MRTETAFSVGWTLDPSGTTREDADVSATDDAAPRRPWFLDLRPFTESPAYFRFWTSGVAAGVGTQLTAVAIGIHIYDLSGSTAAVALVGAFALGPMVVMGVFGGTIVDAFDRRKVLIVASSISFVAPVGIAAIAWAGVETLWPYYAFTTLSATIGSLVGAARFAIHPRLVERRLLPAVAALSGVSAGLQTAVGPALAGILVASVGFAWTYTIDVGLFLIGFWGIVSLPAIVPAAAVRVGLKALREGLGFLRRAANLRTAIAMQVAAFAFGRTYALLPAVGTVVVGGGPVAVGVLAAAAAVGVLLSGLASGRLGDVRRHGRAMTLATAAFGVAIGLFGLLVLAFLLRNGGTVPQRTDVAALVLLSFALVLAGMADNVASIFRTTMMQAATPDEMRGRLQGLFTLVLTAGPRLGDTLAGFAAALVALWFPPIVGAFLILIAVGLLYRLSPGFRRYDALRPIA
jgi:MFS family permease